MVIKFCKRLRSGPAMAPVSRHARGLQNQHLGTVDRILASTLSPRSHTGFFVGHISTPTRAWLFTPNQVVTRKANSL